MVRASHFARIALCPGSYKRSLALPAGTDHSATPEATSGTKIHAALAGLPHPPLEVAEEQVVEFCLDAMAAYVEELGPPDEDLAEQPFSIPAKMLQLGDLEITGTPDRVLIYKAARRAVIFDFKSGWADVPQSDINLQLRIYAIMIRMRYGAAVERIDVVILKPRISRQPDPTVYDREALGIAFKEILRIAKRALEADPEKDLFPSESACGFCPAKADCPAVHRQIEQLATVELSPEVWDATPIEVKLDWWQKLGIAEKAIGTLRARFRADLEANPEAYDGALYLHESHGNREITDPAACFAAFNAEGVTPEQFAGCCDIGLTKLKAALRDAKRFEAWVSQIPGFDPSNADALWHQFQTLDPKEVRKIPCLKGDAFEKHFNELLAPLCERKPRKASVEVNKERLQALLEAKP